MERYYQPEIECASQEQLRAWQDERLVKQVRNVWDNVPYYRKKMEEKGLTPDDIQGVADLHKLPFVTKADLREAYPYGLLARPLKDCVRIHSTSGTTGKRVVAFYTQHDVDLWEDCCARAIMARPSVIFADEPTGNLDSRSSREVLGFLRDSVRDYGQSIVMVTHDPRAASFADRVLVLADGNITRDMQHPTYNEILEVFAGDDDIDDVSKYAASTAVPTVTEDSQA